jgi:uncharacterized protein YggE
MLPKPPRFLLSAALLLLLSACATEPLLLSTQSGPPEHTITVNGSASSDVMPDEACVELTLTARDATMAGAHAALVANNDALVAELRGRPGLAVEPGAPSYGAEYENDGSGHSHVARYFASTQVNVRTRDFTQVPDVIGRAAARGLERVGVVYYSTQIAGKKAAVRTEALEAAQQKALAMSAALGVHLGEVVTIVEGGSSGNGSVGGNSYLERAAVDKTPDAPAPPGSIPLSTAVTVVYRLH